MNAPTFWTPEFVITTQKDGIVTMRQTGELPPYRPTIIASLIHWATQCPDRIFLAERDAEQRWATLTYANALAYSRALAAGLLEQGLGPDKPLIILSENSVSHALLGLAAQYAGVPYAPLSPSWSTLSGSFTRLKAAVNLLNPGLVFAEDGDKYRDALAALPDIPAICAINPPTNALTMQDLAASRGRENADKAYASVNGKSVAKYLFTSGSTGTPKAVINTQNMLASNQAMMVDCMPFLAEEPPVIVDWSPWHHTAGGNYVFNMVLVNGGSFYLDDGRPSPTDFWKTVRNIKDVRPTWHFAVPVFYDQLAKAITDDSDLAAAFFERNKMMVYAGAGLAQHSWDTIKQKGREISGSDILFCTNLGSTETAPFAFGCTDNTPSPGNVGVPARGLKLKLIPCEGGYEPLLKGPSITQGYFKNDAGTRDAFDEDGFYHLGDAIRPADPDDLSKGFFFAGRLAENFKLSTGTWVRVGALRSAIVDAFGGLLRDVVVVGENHSELGALGIANDATLGELAGGTLPENPLSHPAIKAAFQQRLNTFAATASGSSTKLVRMTLLGAVPDPELGEITDKGSLNQRALRQHRTDQIEAMYNNQGTLIIAAKPK